MFPRRNCIADKQRPRRRPGRREAGTRIALVNLQQDYGGAERHVLSLACGLSGRGHDVRVVCHPRGRLYRSARDGGLGAVGLATVGHTDPVAAARLLWQIRRWRPDVLHLHTPKDYLIGTLAGRLTRGTSVVFTRHLLLPVKPHMRRLYGRSDAVICPCRALRDQLASEGVSPAKLELIYGAIDGEPFFGAPPENGSAFRRELGLSAYDTVIGILGRLVPGKGHHVLLEAVSRLGAGEAAPTLLMVGDGPEQPALRAQALQLGIADRIVFMGFRTDVVGVMAALDVVVLASTHTEVLPLAVLEAMAAGRAVVATSVGGVPEIIEEGCSGLLVPPGDADALAAALRRLIDAPALRADLGRAAAERVRQEFTLPRMVAETESLYRRLSEARGRRDD